MPFAKALSTLQMALWPSFKAVIRSHGTNGRTPGADLARVFWVRGECAWCQARGSGDPQEGSGVFSKGGYHGNVSLPTVAQKMESWRDFYVTFGPLKVRILIVHFFKCFFFFPFIKFTCVLSPLSLRLSLFCIVALVQGGYSSISRSWPRQSAPFLSLFIIYMFRCLNLDSMTIQPVQHFVGERKIDCLAKGDEFHLCTHGLSISATSAYSVASLGQVLRSLFVLSNFVSSMLKREEV